MYQLISSLRPYFFSLREIENTISLDLKLPTNWMYENITVQFNIDFKIQDTKSKIVLISFITNNDEDNYDNLFNCAFQIIEFNKEIEEKQKLLQEKIFELQELFKTSSIQELRDLILLKPNGQEIATGSGMVEEGTAKRQPRNRKQQEKVDNPT